MLNNTKLNRRIKKIFKYLRDNWGITLYKIAVETKIPHSSLKYMMDEKFEWKLNHLLSIVDFLNRNNAKISLEDFLDFDNKKPFSEIINISKADFNKIINGEGRIYKRKIKQGIIRPLSFQKENEELAKEIVECIKDSPLFTNKKITVEMQVSGNNFGFHQDIRFLNGKRLKD